MMPGIRTPRFRPRLRRLRLRSLTTRPRLRSVTLVLLPLACASPAPPAPEAPPPAAAVPVEARPGEPIVGLPRAGSGGRVVVVPDPGSTTLAAAVAVPGSAWELPGTEGLTLLSAMTVLEAVRPALARLGAEARVTCDPAAFTFTLVAPRDAGTAALDVFLDGLFQPAPTPESLGRARARLAASLALEQATPAWEARLALRRALVGDTLGTGWLGPVCGDPETLDRLDLAEVRAGSRRFGAGLARVAVITADSAGPVKRLVEARVPSGPAPAIPAPRSPASGLAFVERSTVTVWTAVAFPFGPDADLEALRLLGAVLQDAIAPGVERPDVFAARHELQRHGSGGALVVTAITSPEAVDRVVDRVERRASEVAWTGIPAPIYERVARRHRGLRFLSYARPEARAAAMALDLAFGRPPAPWPEPEISPERLQAAARALRPPARARVGPPPARGDSMP